MRFGSVEFFKVLIKTVLAIVFFVPLVLCIVLSVLLWNKTAELDRLTAENERIVASAELLLAEKAPDIESFYEIYRNSGFSDEDFADYISNKGAALSGGASDAQASAPEENTASDSGAQSESAEAASNAAEDVTRQASEESAEPVLADVTENESRYAALYTDMTVSAPSESEMVREEGTVYLTFDDGPSENTLSVLAYLNKYNIKATFFVVPTRTESCFEKLRAITQAGHSIGVHSASHDYDKIYSSVENYLADFYEAWNIIYEATGVKTEIFRFPGGSKNDFNADTRDDIIAEMTRRGFRFFDWNVDSNDAGGATWTDMYNSVPNDISGNYRSVVLMHDSAPRKNTVLVLEDIIVVLLREGYSFDSIHNNTRPVQFVGPFA